MKKQAKAAKKIVKATPKKSVSPKPQKNKSPEPQTIIKNPIQISPLAEFQSAISSLAHRSSYFHIQHDKSQQETRAKSLFLLQEMLKSPSAVAEIIIPQMPLLIDMISKNIFRGLSVDHKHVDTFTVADLGVGLLIDPETPDWPHIQGVYLVFLRLLTYEKIEIKHIKPFITGQFINSLISLFDSNSKSERSVLAQILMHIYNKLIPKRNVLRNAIKNELLCVIYENNKLNGLEQLLYVLQGIIAGFTIPLRQENIDLFNDILIPLHKVKHCEDFGFQLSHCTSQYFSKDFNLALLLIPKLLRYWPVGNSNKEFFFLDQLTDCIKISDPSKLSSSIIPLTKRIVKCLVFSSFQVSARAAQLIREDFFQVLLRMHHSAIAKIVAPLELSFASSSVSSVFLSNFSVFQAQIRDINESEYTNYRSQGLQPIGFEQFNSGIRRILNESKWDAFQAQALLINAAFSSRPLPYSPACLPLHTFS
jgi:serine/threonine-protein phosphatase 2A regulatory subunit B'